MVTQKSLFGSPNGTYPRLSAIKPIVNLGKNDYRKKTSTSKANDFANLARKRMRFVNGTFNRGLKPDEKSRRSHAKWDY